MPSDEELVSSFLAGDIEAFNLLVRRWQKPIYNFIYRYVGNREDARDLCQEVFTTAFRQLKHLKQRSKFAPWLYKVALNWCRMQHRAEKGRTHVPLGERESLEQSELNMTLGDHVGPEEVFSRKETVELVQQALKLISEEQREVILMKEYQGLKFHEIAEILNCPLSTVKSRMYFGLKNLKRELDRLRLARRFMRSHPQRQDQSSALGDDPN